MAISRLVILDSGHNEYVAGKEAPDKSMREWEFNNDMQYKIAKRCKDHNISTYMTNPQPAGKNEIGLSLRCNLANNYYNNNGRPKTIFMSLHSNAHLSTWSSARGTETYVASNASTTSKNFAKSVNDEIVKTCRSIDSGAKDRGVKTNDFYVIKNTIMPCVLIEYAFYSNQEDLKILKNNRNDLTEATVKSICNYFGVTYVPPTPVVPDPEPEPDPEPIPPEPLGDVQHYRVMIGPFSDNIECINTIDKLTSQGYKFCYPDMYRNEMVIIVGDFIVKHNAYSTLTNIQTLGYRKTFITTFIKKGS